MMKVAIALISGALFGAGLALSGMADPMRVRAFLDLLGPWDPTLAFVMGGAMIPMAVAWVVQKRLERSLAGAAFNLPETRRLDWKLALGAILFGIGWGLGGLCPGPAIASLALKPIHAAPFVLAMLAGMALNRFAPSGTAGTSQRAKGTSSHRPPASETQRG
ncbi:putative transporter component [Sphingobium chlorophenolicum]|uniref:Putative transporter component n=1 Tax=Sphingobium chlorophenolicum TaxID=46429 RepID=A0A081RCK0_SPHCR|nr:putative transporter component [Sphingobium chlorophenolicum]